MTVVIKKWTSTESPPEQLRWKMSFWDNTTYLECESDSLWDVIRVMFTAWRRRRAQKDDNLHRFQRRRS